MQRGHRRPGVATQGVVHARPGGAPEVFAHLLHDPPHLLAGQALPGRPPGRCGGRREVDDAADVEDRGEPARRAREALRMADEDVEEPAVGLEEPEPVDPGQGPVEQADPAPAGEGALEADVGKPAEADARGRRRSGSGCAGGRGGAQGRRTGSSWTMVKAHICIAKRATSRPRVRGRRTASASGPAAQAATVTGGGIRPRRRSSGTAKAAARAPAAPARRATRKAGDGLEGLRISARV